MTVMSRETGTVTASRPVVALDETAHHARIGNGIHKWVNGKVPGATAVVLTDATMYYNIPEDEQVLIKCLQVTLLTTTDDVSAELVGCSAVNGGGTPTAISEQCTPSQVAIWQGESIITTPLPCPSW